MGDLESIQAQMSKVRAATLGEVIMFSGIHPMHLPVDCRTILSGGLCIYSGISEKASITVDGEQVFTTLDNNHTFEIAVIEADDGLYCPTVRPSLVENYMTLREKGRVSIGPEEISRFFSLVGCNVLGDFFKHYVSRFRGIRH
ncbi:MAG: hypothetical protein KAT43_03445 [Nanoarchaeota archaeon]|nr:hypothetical protein [Nanoarchaeota archaeon]